MTEKSSSYESLISTMELYGINATQARIQVDAAIEEALLKAAQGGADFVKVRSVVGNHSVMLHNLQEKIVSLSDMQDGRTPVGAYEILDMLMDWASESRGLLQNGIGNADPGNRDE